MSPINEIHKEFLIPFFCRSYPVYTFHPELIRQAVTIGSSLRLTGTKLTTMRRFLLVAALGLTITTQSFAQGKATVTVTGHVKDNAGKGLQ